MPGKPACAIDVNQLEKLAALHCTIDENNRPHCGGAETGVWYVIDIAGNAIVHEDTSRGNDAHGVAMTPDGREAWIVNRVTDDVLIVDPATFEIIEHVEEGFGDAPDIIGMSPDSSRAFITLRGPNPVSAPHVAVARRRGSPPSTSPRARWSRRCNRTRTTKTAISTASASE